MLTKHATDLEHAISLQQATLASYADALETMAQFAVEVDASYTGKHRESLREIRSRLTDFPGQESLAATPRALRLELSGYRDKCESFLNDLNRNFTSALLSLHQVIGSISSSEGNNKPLAEHLETLVSLAAAGSLPELRAGLSTAAKSISACVEQIQREHELAIVQFKDELRTIQGRVESAESKAARDPVTGALNRAEIEALVRKDMSHDASVCLAIVKIFNYEDLRGRHGQSLLDEAIVALYRRLRSQLGESSDVGRWREDAFVTRLTCARPDAMRISHVLSLKLDKPYICLWENQRRNLHLRVEIAVVHYQMSEDAEKFLAKADLFLQQRV